MEVEPLEKYSSTKMLVLDLVRNNQANHAIKLVQRATPAWARVQLINELTDLGVGVLGQPGVFDVVLACT